MSLKGLTSNIFNLIAESSSVLTVAFSRKSFYEKSIALEFGFKPWQINKTLRRLEKSKFIRNKNSKLYLTQKGITTAKYYQIRKIEIKQKSQWDKKWRLIIFDIPEKIREVRDALRNKLKQWNCYKIQNSVFAYPFSCEKEIRAINRILEIEPYLHVFLINNLGGLEEKVRRYYHL